MTRREMLADFARKGVAPSMFWLGDPSLANNVNGMAWNGESWIVYYRERGMLFDLARFEREEDAVAELHRRVLQSTVYSPEQRRGD